MEMVMETAMHIQKYRRNEFVPLMIELVKLYHPKTYVEIGVAEGYTFNVISQMPQIKEAHAVDIKIGDKVVKPDVFVTTGSASGHPPERIWHWQMSSQDFVHMWPAYKKDGIDVLFIDGDHNKETVEHDFFEIGKFVRTGTGLILMHDTHPMTEELLQPQFCNNAWKFASELFDGVSNQYELGPLYMNDDSYRYFEVLTLPGPWAGLTIVKKRGQHHLCWENEDG
jgi:hypothetical protein